MDKNFKIIWKVHSKNFNNFITYVDRTYKHSYYLKFEQNRAFGDMFELYEDRSCEYLLIGIATSQYGSIDVIVSAEVYSVSLLDYAISVADWVYQGEFNGRKEKLKRLNKLSGM